MPGNQGRDEIRAAQALPAHEVGFGNENATIAAFAAADAAGPAVELDPALCRRHELSSSTALAVFRDGDFCYRGRMGRLSAWASIGVVLFAAGCDKPKDVEPRPSATSSSATTKAAPAATQGLDECHAQKAADCIMPCEQRALAAGPDAAARNAALLACTERCRAQAEGDCKTK